jgi:hypothetical protein
MLKLKKTPSLKDALTKINSIGRHEATTEIREEEKSPDLPRNTFTQDDLEDRWSVFVEKLKKKDVRMFSALKVIQPSLVDTEKIQISFQNNAQLEEYQLRLRPILLKDFKEAFKNEYIEITEVVVDAEKMDKPNLLSDKEKLEKMIEKNPALQSLKNKFKLDFE